jgi:F-type H+-transporting ATPase subunit b
MKKLLFMVIALAPLSLFASDSGVETDFFQRFVNFVLFAAIIYYLLADKLKAYFAERRSGIQAELDKVQEVLKESQSKVDDAKAELEESQKIAEEIISSAKSDVANIKDKISKDTESQIDSMNKSLQDRIDLDTRKSKDQVVNEILKELFDGKSVDISKNDLANIVLKKVA